jgi:DNA polymerase III subunit chi
MSDIRFYHLTTQSLEQVLPAILNKALAGGRRAVVRFSDETEAVRYNDHLWTYAPESFLPHGLSGEEHAALQPVLLTTSAENANGADMLVLCDAKTVPENTAEFSLCCDFLNGQDDESVAAARTRWKAYKDAGHTVTYWQQTDTGGWEQKA